MEAMKGNGKDSPVLMPERFGEAESMRHDYVVNAPVGVTLEQVMDPSYWAHVAKEMVPFDHVQVRAEDGSWVAYLVVVSAERNYAIMHLDRVLKLDQTPDVPVESAKHKVEWKGPHHKFCVIRIADSAMLQSQFKTKGEANDWLRNHEKAQ